MFAQMISEQGISAKKVNHLVKNRLAEAGIQRKSRASEDFEMLVKFFKRTNEEIEVFVDRGDERIAVLFKGRNQEQIAKLLRQIRDCRDNLGVVLDAFEVEQARVTTEPSA